MDTRTSPIRLRIAQLREELHRQGVQAVLVPSADPHLSEYLPGRWQGREWFSGFTGSMGTLVVTIGEAALFADSRYWTQAEAELAGTTVELVKIPTGAATHPIDWLTATLSPSQTLAVDAREIIGILRHDLEKIIRRSRHQMAFEHIGHPGHFPLERVQKLIGLALQRDLDKNRGGLTQFARVQQRDIGGDQ